MEQKRSTRAAFNKQWGHMRPAGRQFDMPAVGGQLLRDYVHKQILKTSIIFPLILALRIGREKGNEETTMTRGFMPTCGINYYPHALNANDGNASDATLFIANNFKITSI
jgi:hypothetical protein